MSDHADDHDGDDHHDHPEPEGPVRTTAPQQAFTSSQVGIGFAVLAVGLVLTFGLALGLTL
jgi:hypothetical protein